MIMANCAKSIRYRPTWADKKDYCKLWKCEVVPSGKCFLFKWNSKDFSDELDGYLFENHQVKAGCCSSVESLKYDIAREVAERLIEKYNIDIQYVSQEKRRRKLNEMYGLKSE